MSNFTTGPPEITLPTGRSTKPGTRVRSNVSGHEGTVVKKASARNNGLIVDWDDRGFGVRRGRVPAPGWNLTEIDE